ncbi:MAG: homoserine dehydrogenase [Rhodovulum sulfidophilum]|uniref:Homoserine dehydrogenase n=1 Tax=Rhodovulum sulfidophilum TaxID=35806 RepID=A0A2W5N173_RHOSU|nr:MAG: homoserine dehydrogenase [Rhodovulum sulfidophilum]
MRVLKVAITGFGNVGRATADLLLSRRERYRHLHGTEVRLVAVCGSSSGLFDADGLETDRLRALEKGLTGPDFIAASGAAVVIEAGPSDFRTGGPGFAYLRSALSDGRDAIVISKGALVHGGRDLRALARRSGALLKISGAAAAALPTLDLLEHGLLGCRVLKLEGILNATTNYLLDAMTARGIGFEEALREARSGGFAEADARDDIEGWDTAAKLLLIANFGLGRDLAMEDISVSGIQSVTGREIAAWRANGLVPKLVATLAEEGGVVRAEVRARTYRLTDPFAHVGGKGKAVRFTTDAMGETVAISTGAEPLATAAAALKDLEHILIARAEQGPRLGGPGA